MNFLSYLSIMISFLFLLIRSDNDSFKSKEIIKQIHKVNNDGTYTVGYEADDGSFKMETRDVLGNIKGSFGYIDDKGTLKRVTYTTTSGKHFNFSEEIANSHQQNNISEVKISTTSTTSTPTTNRPISTVIQSIPKRTDYITSAIANLPAQIISTTDNNEVIKRTSRYEKGLPVFKTDEDFIQLNDYRDIYNTDVKQEYKLIEQDPINNNNININYRSESSEIDESKSNYNQMSQYDEKINQIEPPVSTSDFQLLLNYLLLRQNRLKEAKRILEYHKLHKQLQQSIHVPIIDPQNIQQPTVFMILPRMTTYNEGHKYVPILSSNNRKQVATFIRKRQLVENSNERQYEEKRNYLLPSNIREMLLLKMLQIAINPDLPSISLNDNREVIDTFRNGNGNENENRNKNQNRNIEIVRDEKDEKNKHDFIEQNQYQNPIYMNY